MGGVFTRIHMGSVWVVCMGSVNTNVHMYVECIGSVCIYVHLVYG